ncbi:cupin domain-containing protein [Streptomyces sp. NPDC127079]|uniref:cupin domain-containing protein n=1 Tax=Streptomyces sp. NPDC127079 TaxID=3347132 RepID=UPI0036525833
MEPDPRRQPHSEHSGTYRPAGDDALYRPADGIVAPVVTRAGLEDVNTADSGGAVRVSGVSAQHTPARRLWYGKVSNEPGYRSVSHHHGEAETGGYVLSGRARIYFGERFEDYVDMAEGDWVFVPPFMPHVECNLSRTRPLVWMTTRTPDNIVVNLPDVTDADLRDWLNR